MKDFVPIDTDRLLAVAGLLQEIDGLRELYGGDWFSDPGSPASGEFASASGNRNLELGVDAAYGWASLILAAVAEHARAFGDFLKSSGGSPPGALSTDVIARSALESSARTWWLMERGLNAEQRVARMLAHELYGAHNLDDLASSLGWTAVPEAGVATQAELVGKLCDQVGFSSNGNSSGESAWRIPPVNATGPVR